MNSPRLSMGPLSTELKHAALTPRFVPARSSRNDHQVQSGLPILVSWSIKRGASLASSTSPTLGTLTPKRAIAVAMSKPRYTLVRTARIWTQPMTRAGLLFFPRCVFAGLDAHMCICRSCPGEPSVSDATSQPRHRLPLVAVILHDISEAVWRCPHSIAHISDLQPVLPEIAFAAE